MGSLGEQSAKQAKQERFMQLRANGMSYDAIAKVLKVSKPTLISWSRDLQIEIHNLREIQKESLREQFAISKRHRVEILSEQLKKARDELAKRDYGDVPTLQLLSAVLKIEQRIAQEEIDATAFEYEYVGVAVLPNSGIEKWNG
jgi:transposase